MGGKSSGKIQVNDYYMSLHFGICAAGKGLSLLSVRVSEKTVWVGELADRAERVFIGKPNLFGGIKKAGGLRGIMHWLPGGSSQVLTTGLAQRLGLTRRNAPAYRNIASVFFTGARRYNPSPEPDGWDDWVPDGTSDRLGFLWGSNNPYLRPVWFRMRRPPQGLNPAKAMMLADPDRPHGPQAANGAHIIYECLTNRTWGAGMSPAGIDRASFERAGDTLFDEGFGLCAKWVRQSPVQDFVNEVLDHINATLFLHPRTGKMTLKLLRDDYDVSTLRVIDPSNAKLTRFARKMWGETANEIVVTWTNPLNDSEETISAHDLANCAIQGAPISSSRNYHMVRSAKVAYELAQRELGASAFPIITADLEMNRKAWDVIPGEVCVLTWPEHGIERVIVRVASAGYGEAGSGSVKFSVLEDIFGVPLSQFTGAVPPPDPETDDPQPVALYHAMTAPAMFAARAMDLSDPESIEHPDAIVVLLAVPRPDDVSLLLWSDVTLPSGTVEPGQIGMLDFAGTARLTQALLPRPTAVLGDLYDLAGWEPRDGDFILIGSGADTATELAVVTAVDDNGAHVNRGVLDTVPRPWPAGTRLWHIRARGRTYDSIVRADGEAVSYRLLPQTSVGTLEYEDAADVVVTPSARAVLPLRPADVRVRGRQWGPVGTSTDTDLTITWATRNRIVEASVALPWTAASAGAEVGQTTKVTVLSSLGAVLATHAGLTGTSLTISLAPYAAEEMIRVRVSSVRDGFESLQAYEIEVFPGQEFSFGYGGAYGENYGG